MKPQKSTGMWTSQSSMEVGALVLTIHAVVEMRLLSSLKSERVIASKFLGGAKPKFSGNENN
jgi:6-phosphogluconate dehydrogenase